MRPGAQAPRPRVGVQVVYLPLPETQTARRRATVESAGWEVSAAAIAALRIPALALPEARARRSVELPIVAH